MNPISESITLLRILSANPEIKPRDDIINILPAKQKGIAFFEGCLPMLNLIGLNHKLFDLTTTRKSIHKLLDKIGLDYGSIPGLLCPSKSLLEIDIERVEDIVKKISENNISRYKKINPDKLILGTPESFNTFSKLKEYKNIESLPDVLFDKLKNIKSFSKINKTIGIHSACNIDKDPFYTATRKILNLIPGVTIVELKDRCGYKGFDSLNAESKESSLNFLQDAYKNGVDIVVCTSPYCESNLLMCQREGSWRTIEVEILDIYRLLLKSMVDGDIK
jgi:Fe-S oxidoreductase